jgi:hypothetical protein
MCAQGETLLKIAARFRRGACVDLLRSLQQ